MGLTVLAGARNGRKARWLIMIVDKGSFERRFPILREYEWRKRIEIEKIAQRAYFKK